MFVTLAALVAFGCQSSDVHIPTQSDLNKGAPVSSKAKTPEPPKQDPTAPATSGGQQTTKPDDTKNQAKPKEKPFNPARMFQLKDLQVIDIKINKKTFKTWVMDTPGKLEEGMMFLKNEDVEDNEAMIFIYNAPEDLNFWMKNTLIPLDIAYVTDRKVIHHIAHMKALDETAVPSRGPVQYAIEFKLGALKKYGVTQGMKVEMPDGLKLKIDQDNGNGGK